MKRTPPKVITHDDGALEAVFEPGPKHSFLELCGTFQSLGLVFDSPKQAKKFLTDSLKLLEKVCAKGAK